MPDNPRFSITWQLTIEHEQADTLQDALEPETDPEHATLTLDDAKLVAHGEGTTGTCLHTLDDLLACLTGAVDALDLQETDGSR